MSIPFPGVKGGKELTLASRLWKIFLEEMPQHSKSIKKKKKVGVGVGKQVVPDLKNKKEVSKEVCRIFHVLENML